jgi:hypothetical protein
MVNGLLAIKRVYKFFTFLQKRKYAAKRKGRIAPAFSGRLKNKSPGLFHELN